MHYVKVELSPLTVVYQKDSVLSSQPLPPAVHFGPSPCRAASEFPGPSPPSLSDHSPVPSIPGGAGKYNGFAPQIRDDKSHPVLQDLCDSVPLSRLGSVSE
jgi:hypothetical protein